MSIAPFCRNNVPYIIPTKNLRKKIRDIFVPQGEKIIKGKMTPQCFFRTKLHKKKVFYLEKL